MKYLFKKIVLEYHGGPIDGLVVRVHPTEIESMLAPIGDDLFLIMSVIDTGEASHLYVSNGPYDDPILESHIPLDYADVKRTKEELRWQA